MGSVDHNNSSWVMCDQSSEMQYMLFDIHNISTLEFINCFLHDSPSIGYFSGSNLIFQNSIFSNISGGLNDHVFTVDKNQYNRSQAIASKCIFDNVQRIRLGYQDSIDILLQNCVFYHIYTNPAISCIGSGLIDNCDFLYSGFDQYNYNGTFFAMSGIYSIRNSIFDHIALSSQGMGHPCFIALYGGYGTSIVSLDYCATIPYVNNGLCESQYGSQINVAENNIYLNPEIYYPSFTLSPSSPCIDAGDPNSPLDSDGTRADIGAYYFCQGEGISLPDIVRTSTEPGYPEPITATLQSSCDPVAIDSARTETGLFTLDSYPSQVAGEFKSGDFQLTFHPSVQGVFTDTLHIWANTDPPHHKIPLVGESGPIPAPVTDLSISILPDLSAQLTWSPVTQTIYGNPVTPDWYLVFYNELDPQVEEEWYYQGAVATPGYQHFMVARFADLMNYRVVAWKGIDPALLGWVPGMKMAELEGATK